ncbi:MAG: glycoside hydrolase family 2 [Kiritimatiellaeota bacterium]|nr:glycoside hydrolase family 2 [Kiritimatiellota bacterium]
MKHTIPLDGAWRLRFGPQTTRDENDAEAALATRMDWPEVDAEVPGNVELDLLRAGVIEDPARGANVHALRKYEKHEWWYTRTFEWKDLEGELPCEPCCVELVFEGLDCLATVWLNNTRVGASDNALIAHRFDVTAMLRPGENTLVVRLASAVLEGFRHEIAPGENSAGPVNFESLHVRKPPHCYGWDIMPRVVSAGIWRGVRLDISLPTRWRGMHVATRSVDVAKRTAFVMVDWDFETDRDVDNLRVALTFASKKNFQPSAISHHTFSCLGTHGRAHVELKDVDFWWPLGSGEPALYDFTAELLEGETRLDEWRENIGVRTIELRRTELTNPQGDGEFVFLVNGERVFVKGTNWVPLDALHSRDAAWLDKVFPMIPELGCNMVRCWGGNVYEDHAFFDLCDRTGVMVWQDFAMACAVYPQTREFHQAVETEAEAVVKKLRNHPSLALWAGNNECDDMYDWSGLGANPNRDDLITRRVLPSVVRRWDPFRSYLPSSPVHDKAFYEQEKSGWETLPEQHLWGPRDDFKGNFYTGSSAHFVSEIGYHGCPSRKFLEKNIPAEELWPVENTPSWLALAVQPHPGHHDYDYRINLMKKQAVFLFGKLPDNLDDFIFASQASQAEAKKFFIEWFRIAKWRRTGILWWNLRDGWPIISDAIVEYDNTRKLAFDYIKRSQSMVCAMCGEPQDGAHPLVVVNDHRAAKRGTLRAWQAGEPATTLWEGAFEIEPNGRGKVADLPQAAQPAVWFFEWTLEDNTTGRNHYLAGPRPFDLAWYRERLKAFSSLAQGNAL